MPPITRADWKNSPLPARQARLDISRTLLDSQMDAIRNGLLPESQDDRWFMFYEQYRLHIHRSWTGYCIYVAYFRAEKGTWILTHADANRDPEQYTQTDDAADAHSLAALIDTLLLHEPNDYIDPAIPAELQAFFRWNFYGKAP